MSSDDLEELERLRQKIAYYQAPLPRGKGHCYHRFTDEGICIRCGEDAEEWDAGCVEEIVEDLQSVTTREFADALKRVLAHAARVNDAYEKLHVTTVERYLDKIEKFAKQWDQIESWKERPSVVDVADGADQPDSDNAADFTLDL